MWEEDQQRFAERHGLTSKQSGLLRATGEHLIPFSLAGPATKKNIVVACLHCNKCRHKNGGQRTAEAYLQRVHARMNSGRWHPFKTVNGDARLLASSELADSSIKRR